VVLSVAGLDPGGGAGLIAEVKTIEAHDCWPAAVATALTVQRVTRVHAVHPVPARCLVDQIEAVFADLDVVAVKVGLLPTRETVLALADVLADRRVPVVLDPVCRSTSGTRFLDAAAIDAVREALLPSVHVVTPNAEEAGILASGCAGGLRAYGAALLDLGPSHVLITGGAGDHGICEDLLFSAGEVQAVRHRSISTNRDHGTGCVHSSSVAAHLAHGATVLQAVTAAGRWMEHVLERAVGFGGRGAPDAACRATTAVVGSRSGEPA
jgi:hydroxymethylpyrimidine/phosphomethylpyrimidine kinase